MDTGMKAGVGMLVTDLNDSWVDENMKSAVDAGMKAGVKAGVGMLVTDL